MWFKRKSKQTQDAEFDKWMAEQTAFERRMGKEGFTLWCGNIPPNNQWVEMARFGWTVPHFGYPRDMPGYMNVAGLYWRAADNARA